MTDSNRPPRPHPRPRQPAQSGAAPQGPRAQQPAGKDPRSVPPAERVSSGGSTRSPAAGQLADSEAAAAPSLERIMLYPCYRGQVRTLTLFGFLSLLAIYGSWAVPSLALSIQLWGDGTGGGYLLIPLLVVLPLVPLLRAIMAVYDATYVIDDDGIEARIGLLSLKLRLPKLRWEDIRGSALKQGLIERVLNVGTIEVDSAMTEDVEIMMSGIANAKSVHQLIMKERERRWRAAGHLWHVEKALTD